MITSHIEMLELPNFGYMTASTRQFDSRNNCYDVITYTEIMSS